MDKDEEDRHDDKQRHVTDQFSHGYPSNSLRVRQRFLRLYLSAVSKRILRRPAKPASSSCQCATSGSPSFQHKYTSRLPIKEGKSMSPAWKSLISMPSFCS